MFFLNGTLYHVLLKEPSSMKRLMSAVASLPCVQFVIPCTSVHLALRSPAVLPPIAAVAASREPLFRGPSLLINSLVFLARSPQITPEVFLQVNVDFGRGTLTGEPEVGEPSPSPHHARSACGFLGRDREKWGTHGQLKKKETQIKLTGKKGQT